MWLDYILSLILIIGDAPFCIMMICAGYLCHGKQIFFRTYVIFLFSCILSAYLKSIWQIPHPNQQIWAFPSGHMMFLTSIWMWLAYEFKNSFLAFLAVILLCLEGYTLIHYNYHNIYDILAGVGFAIMSLPIYFFIFKSNKNATHPTCGILLISTILIYLIPNTNFTPGVWKNLGALLGIIIGYHYNQKHISLITLSSVNNAIKILLAMSGCATIYYIFEYIMSYVTLPLNMHVIYFVECFLLGWWILFATEYIMQYAHLKYKKTYNHSKLN